MIAARNRLDIGATTITNRENALLFSAGDMSIGGSLDATSRDATVADQIGGINVSLSIGSGKSSSDSVENRSTAAGSTVTAGGNLNIIASGAAKDSTITIIGSEIKGGNNVTLQAEGAIKLLAAQNTAEQHSTNSSSSASVGVSYGTSGLLFTASASSGRGNADGSDVSSTNTHVEAGNLVSINSGGDTALRGVVVTATQVTAAIGGNLSIESLQDTSHYDSQQLSIGGSITIGTGMSDGSLNASQQKMNSNFASVIEQSGIKAGDGGFQVNVTGNTDLKGALISSTDKAIIDNRNTLSTATLTTSDRQNAADASVKSSNAGFSSDAPQAMQSKYGIAKAVIGTLLANGSQSESSSGVSASAISAGEVTITDDAKQQGLTGKNAQETIASLNRDTANANQVVQRLDVQAMAQTVQAEQAINAETFRIVTINTDAAYNAMFKAGVQYYQVTCSGSQQECLNDPIKMTMQPISQDEAKKSGNILAVNGILNDADRAAQLAYQNAPLDDNLNKPSSITLMHIARAATTVGDLMVGVYESGLAPTLGYTNADYSYADTLQGRGDEATLSLGHSRGISVQLNAFNITADNGYTNKNLSVLGYGSPNSVESYTTAASRVTTDEGKKNITFTYMGNDPVSVLAAGNPGDAWAAFKELINVMLSSNSAHSCGGTGAWGCVTIANPAPGGAVPTNQQVNNVKTYQGGVLVNPEKK